MYQLPVVIITMNDLYPYSADEEDDALARDEELRVKEIMSLPRFKGHNYISSSLHDFIYCSMYDDIVDYVMDVEAIVCMEGVLKSERRFISEIQRICAGTKVPLYFEDILRLELKGVV